MSWGLKSTSGLSNEPPTRIHSSAGESKPANTNPADFHPSVCPWPAFLVVAVASSLRCIRGEPSTPPLLDNVLTLHLWRRDVDLAAPPCAGGPSHRARTM
ncbi:hypothetical protein MHYP_G00206270 [Metynnis hypsauchen]